jgi:hypothetical protein
MKKTVLSIMLLFALAAAFSILTKKDKPLIFVKSKSGGSNIRAEELSGATLRQLGMTDELNRREADKHKADFEESQREKGLVQFGGKWMTPSQKLLQSLRKSAEANNQAIKRETEYIRKADDLIMAKYRDRIPFKVFQPNDEGSLCSTGRRFSDYSFELIYDGEIFFWLGADRSVTAQDEKYVQSFYWAGTYTYTTVEHKKRTVNSFTTDRDLARKAVRAKFGLFDKLETAAAPPSPGQPSQPGAGTPREPEPSSFGSDFIVTDGANIDRQQHSLTTLMQMDLNQSRGGKSVGTPCSPPQCTEPVTIALQRRKDGYATRPSCFTSSKPHTDLLQHVTTRQPSMKSRQAQDGSTIAQPSGGRLRAIPDLTQSRIQYGNIKSESQNFNADSTRLGSFTFHNISGSDGEHISGTSTRIGRFGFHDFQSSEGTSLHGTDTQIGRFNFQNFNTSDGRSINGSSTRIGNFDFHNLNTSDGKTINGTSTRIGNFIFHDYRDSDGNTTHGTTYDFGR